MFLRIIGLFSIAALLFTFSSCSDSSENSAISSFFSNEELTYAKNIEEGKKLLENKCYVCHNPKIAENQLIAPPMIAIKEHYMTDDFATFLTEMKRWLNHPDTSYTKMPDAIEKYGLMPKQKYAEESIDLIANYLFRANIEEPNWWNGDTLTAQKEQQTFNSSSEKGMHFAMTTKQVLGKNLMGTIQRKGTLAALQFCNTAAYPLTDSMALVHKAFIQRVSDQPRNPKNEARGKELEYIMQFKEDLINGNEPQPIIERTDGKITFYSPIVTNNMCLQCHGKPADISKEVSSQIAQLYPSDKATGYDENQVRGIWKIIFDEE